MNEQTLFNYLKKTYWNDLTQSKDEFSFYDCYSGSTKTRIELKCRRKHYPTLMIEREKYFKLIKDISNLTKSLYTLIQPLKESMLLICEKSNLFGLRINECQKQLTSTKKPM